MRELSLSEVEMVSGAGRWSDAMDSTARGASYGFVAGKVLATTLRGAAYGSRAGIYGAAVGAAIGLGVGIADALDDED